MREGRPGGMYRVNDCDDPKMRVAKLKANCGTLLTNRPPGYRQQVKDLDFEITQVMQRAAADPRYADDLLSSRVEVSVRWLADRAAINAMFDAALADGGLETPEFYEATIENGGELVRLIPIQLERWSYVMEKPVICEDFFSVAAVCDHARACRLCNMLHAEYPDEIRTARVVVGRQFFGYHFGDILTVQDAQSYIRQAARVPTCD